MGLDVEYWILRLDLIFTAWQYVALRADINIGPRSMAERHSVYSNTYLCKSQKNKCQSTCYKRVAGLEIHCDSVSGLFARNPAITVRLALRGIQSHQLHQLRIWCLLYTKTNHHPRFQTYHSLKKLIPSHEPDNRH